MALLNILEFPDPRLRTKAKPIVEVNDNIRKLAADMLETMYEAPGIGLAATQVNVHKQLIVIDTSEDKDQPLVLINPKILTSQGHLEYEEGCLSVPGFYESVTRSNSVVVQALDLQGESFELEADELMATCIQHEMDHLQGKLFVDYLTSIKRSRIRKKLEKIHRQQA